jgi:hypothetical protein
MWAGHNSNSTKGFESGENIGLGDDDLVAHVVGSSRDKKNWKAFWKKTTGKTWPKECQIYNCGGSASVGAHVYIKNMKGNKWYFILPTCQGCNKDSASDYGSGNQWSSTKKNAVVVATLARECCFD